MDHRGPDDAGEWWAPDGRVGFGHRRLAVLDLSPAGHQPMAADGDLCITYNGEIYNFLELREELMSRGHAFKSNCDTEVILSAYREWGVGCLERFNGMFAFGLYDARSRRLLLARDRAGEKPLFYSQADGTIIFASELKGLLADGSLDRRVDVEALDCFLAEGFVPGDRCILQGVRKLPAAHALLFDVERGEPTVWQYWQLPGLDVSTKTETEDDLLVELEELLEKAIRRQMVSDVPLGILLSGGVDSSLVTALAARSNSSVKTFTVGFPGFQAHDETEHARLIARHFDTDHMELPAERTTPEVLPILARQFDEPIIDSSMIATYLISRLVREHCTVALGGDGGDELFGGYSHYSRLLWMRRAFGWVPRPLRAPIGHMGEALLPVGFKGRNWLQALAADGDRDVPLIASYFDRRTRRGLLNTGENWVHVAEELRARRLPAGGDLLRRSTVSDFEGYLPEDILVKTDRTSMLNSLEMRAPMLDVAVIEFAFGRVPSHLKATATARKVLLKKLVSKLLPANFDLTRKQGLNVPLSSWLESETWLAFFREVLLDGGQGLFRHATIERLLRGQAWGCSNGERLFGLLMFELWRNEYHIPA